MGRVFSIVFLLLLSVGAFAQNSARITTMSFTRGDENGRFTFSVLCDGEVLYGLSHSDVQIVDNGMPIDDFTIVESSSPTIRNPFSAGLVLDVSGSMSGQPMQSLQDAAGTFVQYMDPSTDEAAVFSFSSTSSLLQGMTADTALLQSAITSLGAMGSTAIYDAIYDGLVHVDSYATNSKRAVVVFTDGADNSSTRTPADVILYAQQVDVRVFVIALGSAVNQTVMQAIAQSTGGDYLASPTPAELQALFLQVASFMGRGFDEHVITLKTPDLSAAEHELTVTVVACGEAVTTMRKENALGVTSAERAMAAIPLKLRLEQTVPNPVLAGGAATISYSLSGTDRPVRVRMHVYDVLGRSVAVPVDRDLTPGAYSTTIRTEELPSGVYFYQLQAGAVAQIRKLVVQR